jgi:predicted PurR-regulated permease PerM
MKNETVSRFVLILLVLGISALFLSMIQDFLMALFLAALFSALVHPLYKRFEKWFGGRRGLASMTTLLLMIIVVLIPLVGLLGIVTGQAIKVGESVTPWIQHQISQPGTLSGLFEKIPFYDHIAPHREVIFEKAGALVGTMSKFFIDSLSAFTMGTVSFLFMFFIFLYTMFFFLMDGGKLLEKILYYLPLENREEQRMLERFTSVTRATLKGTALIGILQGALAGMALWAVGIPSAVFWGAIMAVLSVIPGIGSALVWGPVAIVLIAGGDYGKGIGLIVFCGVIVGGIDNFLRPRLVGKDTQMHDVLILLGTLGGIAMFGFIGFIIGPIIAGLFLTVWEIYGEAFSDILPGGKAKEPNPTLENGHHKDI